MAIFGKKTTEKKASAPVATQAITRDVTWVLRSPRITEKAALAAERGVYVFNIDMRATKADVALAVIDAYKVTPVKVTIAKEPRKAATRRTRTGVTHGTTPAVKKAYVTLKKGETIQFV